MLIKQSINGSGKTLKSFSPEKVKKKVKLTKSLKNFNDTKGPGYLIYGKIEEKIIRCEFCLLVVVVLQFQDNNKTEAIN